MKSYTKPQILIEQAQAEGCLLQVVSSVISSDFNNEISGDNDGARSKENDMWEVDW